MSTPSVDRYWINQPSNLQPDHVFHGQCVYVPSGQKGPFVDAYFVTAGNAQSARVSRLALSEGWPEHLRPLKPPLSSAQVLAVEPEVEP